MSDLDAAFYSRMADDGELASLLAIYPDPPQSAGPTPAIFTDRDVPEDAKLPYVSSYGQVSDVADDDKLTSGREIVRDIYCYTERGHTDTLNQIGNRIQKLFRRHALAIDGARTITATATGPIPAPTDESVIGALVTVKIRFEETP
jgi:hypothetical protein